MQLLHITQTLTFTNSNSGQYTGRLFLFQNDTQDFRIGFTSVCLQEPVLSENCTSVTRLNYIFTNHKITIGIVLFFRTTSCLKDCYAQHTSYPFTSLEEAKKVYLKLLLITQENIL